MVKCPGVVSAGQALRGNTQAGRRGVLELAHRGALGLFASERSLANERAERRPDSVGRAYGRGDRLAHGLGLFRFIHGVARKFFRELFEIFLCQRIHLLAASGKSQQNLREGLQVMAVIGGLLHLRHAQLLVPMNAAEPQYKAGRSG